MNSTGKERPTKDTLQRITEYFTFRGAANVTTGRVISRSESKQRNDVRDYLSGAVTGGYPKGSGARVGTSETRGRGTDSKRLGGASYAHTGQTIPRTVFQCSMGRQSGEQTKDAANIV